MREQTGVAPGQELRFVTPEVPAGAYTVKLVADPANPGGDADLYVRVGASPDAPRLRLPPVHRGLERGVQDDAHRARRIYVRCSAMRRELALRPDDRQGGATTAADAADVDRHRRVGHRDRQPGEALADSQPPRRNYYFEITGNGDADLYVKKGTAPTTSSYDCRPYTGDSNETCTVTLSASQAIHVMVRGYASSSTVRLIGKPQ